MIFLKKNKPYLKDILPPNFVDIHSHLLAGIDDGSKSLPDSLLLIQKLKEIGFHQCITTPHVINSVWDNSSNDIKRKEIELLHFLETKKENIPIKAAAEYMMDNYFFELLKNEKLLTLKDNYVLVEMSYSNPPIQLFDIIFELQVKGYQPILAHPERYLYYQKSFTQYEKLIKAGVLFQLNLLSVVGYYGKEVLDIADTLLKKGMYRFVGSDVHNQRQIDSFSDKVRAKSLTQLQECLSNNSIFLF